jgi:hypothetical protein
MRLGSPSTNTVGKDLTHKYTYKAMTLRFAAT